MVIEFGKLYFAATFIDPRTKLRFVKQDENHAVFEECDDRDPNSLATFYPEELIEI